MNLRQAIVSLRGTGKARRITNLQFAKENNGFREACEMVIIGKNYDGSPKTLKPTARQASKWRNKKGAAYKFGRY